MSTSPPLPRPIGSVGLSVDEQQAEFTRWLARHRVSRRGALKGAIGGAGVLTAARLSLPSRAFAAPLLASTAVKPGSYHLAFSGRHLAFGPDPTTEMWLAVQTSGRPPATRHITAEYGLDRSYGHTAAVEVRNLVSNVPQRNGSIFAAEQFYLHALATKLKPATKYHYRWRLADGTATPDATFRTAAPTGGTTPFTFTAIADEGVNSLIKGLNQTKPYPGAKTPADQGSNEYNDDYYSSTDKMRSKDPAATLVALIARDKPAFNIVGGDICYADPSGDGLIIDNQSGKPIYDWYDPYTWDTYLALIDQSAASSPWMFASGNHDMEMLYTKPVGGSLESDYAPHGYGGLVHRLDLGSNGPLSAPTVYSFSYENVAVISLDVNDFSYEIPANLDYTKGAQAQWLERELIAFRKNPDIDFIVAFFHQCAYCTSTTHGSDLGVRDVLDPLFTAYKVDLVFQGHNHQYERTDPLRHTQPTKVAPIGSTIYPDTEGTTYVVVGSGGRPRYAFSAPASYAGHDPTTKLTPVKSFVDDLGGTTTPETVYWSEVRYDDYAYAKVDAVPAKHGKKTTLTVTAISDLNQTVDHFTLSRIAGAAAKETYTPPAKTPEVARAVLLPLAGLAVAGGAAAYLHHRQRSETVTDPALDQD